MATQVNVPNYCVLKESEKNISTLLTNQSVNYSVGNPSYQSFESSDFFPPNFSELQNGFAVNDENKKIGLKQQQQSEDSGDLSKILSDISSFNISEEEMKSLKFPPRDPWIMDSKDEKENTDQTKAAINSGFEYSFKQFQVAGSYSTNASSSCDYNSSYSYSPLSSFDSTTDVNNNNINNYGLGFQMQQQQQQQLSVWEDFEMNGKTVNMEQKTPFQPTIMSTPLSSRRYDRSFSIDNINYNANAQTQTNYQMQIHNVKMNAYNNNNRVNMQQPPPPLPFRPVYYKENKKGKKLKPNKKSTLGLCVFCKNNGADVSAYSNHTVTDAKGRVLCPRLRVYKCPLCGKDGDEAHTLKYCPLKPIVTMEDLAKMEAKRKLKAK